MDIITKFHESALSFPAMAVCVLLLILILYQSNKRKERKINGFFLVIEPYNSKTKTVKLIELSPIQMGRLEKTAEEEKKDKAHSQQLEKIEGEGKKELVISASDNSKWVKLVEELRLSSSNVFDWKPINGASNQKYVKNDILSIEFVHGAPVIGISLRLPITPRL